MLTRDDVTVLNDSITSGAGATQWHIQIGQEHYVISAVDLSVTIPGFRTSETMAFLADEAGDVADWMDLAMVEGKDHETCILHLLDELNGR